MLLMFTLLGNMKSKMIYDIVASLLYDLHRLHMDWFNQRAYHLTIQKIEKRINSEGISFLTKSLPRLAKCFDKALCVGSFNPIGFRKRAGSELPRFLGEFFERIFDNDGRLLSEPCVDAIKCVRQVLYLVYKYELPYEPEQEATVLDDFVVNDSRLPDPSGDCQLSQRVCSRHHQIIARRLILRLFANFDPRSPDVVPRHGPGSVATGELPWEKMEFKRLYQSIDSFYPYTEYFYLSMGHLCDELDGLQKLETLPSGTAKVVLVPKDSRGPRLISMEPLEYQWIQQGLGRAIMRHVESHPLTRGRVNFTNQEPNRIAALQSSVTGERATLDMKEASDRVSLALVRALFPENLLRALEATRTTATELPDGRLVTLKKFAPMGSCLCFPIEALCFWAILVADRMVRLGESPYRASSQVLVFGDDIIVPCSDASDAITRLEEYHLKVNLDKSCTQGFFRESCGVDAYKGTNVTPLRLKKVWRHRRDSSVYSSYISFANECWKRGYRTTALYCARELARIYGAIPRVLESEPSVPALCFDPIGVPETRKRFSPLPDCPKKPYYFRKEEYVWYPIGPTHRVNPDRWCELFRSVANGTAQVRAGSYAIPRRSMLRRGWRNTGGN